MKDVQCIEPEVVGQRSLFDYAALGVENSVIIQQRTSEIKSLVKRVASDIVEIGGKLADVRARLKDGKKDGKDGKFKVWLETEFPEWSQRTAYNYLAVWEKYGSADFAIDGIAPSALYLLSAPSTPEASREMAKQLVRAGHKVSRSTAEELVRQTKPKKLKQAEPIEPREIEEEDYVTGEFRHSSDVAVDDDLHETASTAIRVYVEQAELDEMNRINACRKISDGDPVEFYEIYGLDDSPVVVITSSLSSGAEGVIRAGGWRIVPEKDAQDVTKPERGELERRSYIGTRVNVGTRKKTNWWVIVGPEYEFNRNSAKDEAKAADVQTCRVCGCTATDCRQCVERTGNPCHWVAKNLCSACVAEPIKVLVSQEELDEMDRANACEQIDQGAPVRIIHRADESFVITESAFSSHGPRCTSAVGWLVKPESEAEGVTKREHPADLLDEADEFAESYIGVRINAGSKAQPEWWVVVGPAYEFTLNVTPEPVKKQEPKGLPPGWKFDENTRRYPGGFKAVNLEANLRTLTFVKEEQAIDSAHEIEVARKEGLLGLTGRGLFSQDEAPEEGITPAVVEAETTASTTAPTIERPAAWFKTRIEINITLMPGADAGTRKVMHKVRAGDDDKDVPFVELTTGEDDLLGALPEPTLRCFEKALADFIKKEAAKLAAKSTAQSKSQPAKTKKAKGGKN